MEQATAHLRYLRVAPRKVRFVADLIRRMPVSEAEAQLMLHARKPADHILKLLRSALANARQGNMNVAKLYVKEIRVNEGPKLKRWNPRARGSMAEIQKKMSHITLVLAESEKKGRDFLMPARTKKERATEKKHAEKQAKKEKKDHTAKEEKEAKPTKEKGAVKRMFRRKSV